MCSSIWICSSPRLWSLLAANSSTSLARNECLHLFLLVHWRATHVPAERAWFAVGFVPTPVVPGDPSCCYTSELYTPGWAFSLLVLQGQGDLLKEVYNLTTLLLISWVMFVLCFSHWKAWLSWYWGLLVLYEWFHLWLTFKTELMLAH